MVRGVSKAARELLDVKPCGTCRRAPSGRSITRGPLLDDGVANGGGSFTAPCPQAKAKPAAAITDKRKSEVPGHHGEKCLATV